MNKKARRSKLLKQMRNDTPRRCAAAFGAIITFVCAYVIWHMMQEWSLAQEFGISHATRSDALTIAVFTADMFVQLAIGSFLAVFAIIGSPRQKLIAELHDRIAELEQKLESKESEQEVGPVSSKTAVSDEPST